MQRNVQFLIGICVNLLKSLCMRSLTHCIEQNCLCRKISNVIRFSDL